MRLQIIISTFFFLGLTFNKAIAQDNIGIKFFGLSIHPKGEMDNAFLMPNKLDKNGYLVMNLGAELMYEKFLVEDILSVKLVQALYADCAGRLGGFGHIGLRRRNIVYMVEWDPPWFTGETGWNYQGMSTRIVLKEIFRTDINTCFMVRGRI